VLEGEVCACVGVLDVAGADWLVLVVVEFVEPDGRLCAEEGIDDEDDVPGPEGLVWVWADDGGFAVVLLGDWARTAVPRMRPRAVLTNNRFFIRNSFRSRRLRSQTTESPACRFRRNVVAEKAPTIACP
jgi:hypothetical protein